jgi:hypothetical protein
VAQAKSIEKTNGIPDSKKVHLSMRKGTFELV